MVYPPGFILCGPVISHYTGMKEGRASRGDSGKWGYMSTGWHIWNKWRGPRQGPPENDFPSGEVVKKSVYFLKKNCIIKSILFIWVIDLVEGVGGVSKIQKLNLWVGGLKN